MSENWLEIDYKTVVNKITTSNKKLKQKEYLVEGKFPVIDQGQEFIGGYTNDETKLLDCQLPVLVFGDHTKIVKLVNYQFAPGADGTKVLEPKSYFEPKLLHYFTQVLVLKIKDKGYARHYQDIEKSRIPLPPSLEQKAIVVKIEELFSELDNGIENLKTALAKLKIYRQAVLKKAFEGEFTREWRERQTNLPTAEELLKTIKQEREIHYQQQLDEWKSAVKEWEKNGSIGKKPAKPKKSIQMPELKIDEIQKLPQIPTNWFYDYLAYAGELGRGKSKHRPRNDKKLFDGAYPFIQTAEVKAAGTKEILGYSKTYNDFGLAQSKLWPKGTLCITIAANIAETAFLGMDACFPDSVVGYKPFNKIIDPRYIDYFFKATKAKISAYAPATAQKNINLTTLENLIIPFCSLQEQSAIVQEIESRLSVCDKIEETITNSLSKAESLRQSILKKAFEGNLLTPQELETIRNHPDYESAEELLKRIKQERKQS